MLLLEIAGIGGRSDISVTGSSTFNPDFIDLNWVYPGLPPDIRRNVAMIPLKLSNPGPDNWVSPVRWKDEASNLNPKFVFYQPGGMKLPMLVRTFHIQLLESNDDFIRFGEPNVPLLSQDGYSICKGDGTVGLAAGESVYSFNKLCLFDKKNIPNNTPGYDPLPVGQERVLSIHFDPAGVLGLGSQTPVVVRNVRIGAMEILLLTGSGELPK